MSESFQPKPLEVALALTAIAIKEGKKVKVGVAEPSEKGKTSNLYLAEGHSPKTDIASVTHYAEVYVPALLGVLHLNCFDCEALEASDDVVLRADFFATAQMLSAEALDMRLQHEGKHVTKPEVYASDVGQALGVNSSRELLHTIHHQADKNWRKRIRVLVAKANGMGDIDARFDLTKDQMKAVQVVTLPGLALKQDKTHHNQLIKEAFARELQPRMQQTNISSDQLIRGLLEGARSGESTKETLHMAAQVPTKKLWQKP